MSLGAQCQWERGQACSCSVGFSYKFVFYFLSSPLPCECCSKDVACLISTAVQEYTRGSLLLRSFPFRFWSRYFTEDTARTCRWCSLISSLLIKWQPRGTPLPLYKESGGTALSEFSSHESEWKMAKILMGDRRSIALTQWSFKCVAGRTVCLIHSYLNQTLLSSYFLHPFPLTWNQTLPFVVSYLEMRKCH